MNREHLHLEILCWAAVAVAAFSMFATPALSQEAPAFTACLQSEGGQCRLIADTVGIQVSVADGDATISYFVPAEGGWRVDRTESVNDDLVTQVEAGTISEDDAATAFAELLASHDLAYKIPANVSELKREVGLAPQSVLTPQDQVDVIAANLQMTLNLSAATADYLVMKLGLQIVAPTRPETDAASGGALSAPSSL